MKHFHDFFAPSGLSTADGCGFGCYASSVHVVRDAAIRSFSRVFMRVRFILLVESIEKSVDGN